MSPYVGIATEREASQTGAQTIERGIGLLKLVALQGSEGARLLDLSGAAGLARPTVHRMLQRLCAERMLTQDARSKRYFLGSLLYELGLAAPSPVRRMDRMRPVLKDLATSTGDTAYLVMRSGDEAVCLNIEEGSFPIRARTFEVGARRPLGIGAAGLALLAAFPPGDSKALIRSNLDAMLRYRLTEARLLERVEHARAQGWAFSEGTITEGVSGAAVVVPSQATVPYMAISVAAISSRMPPSRMPRLRKELELTARRLAAIEAMG